MKIAVAHYFKKYSTLRYRANIHWMMWIQEISHLYPLIQPFLLREISPERLNIIRDNLCWAEFVASSLNHPEYSVQNIEKVDWFVDELIEKGRPIKFRHAKWNYNHILGSNLIVLLEEALMYNKSPGIMKPIMEKEEFDILRDAGILLFDPTMSKGNKYMFHVPKLVKYFRDKKKDELMFNLTWEEAQRIIDWMDDDSNMNISEKISNQLLKYAESCS